MRWIAVALLAASLPALAACAGSTANDHTVTGRFVRVGGPAPGAPFPLPGTITARAVTGATFTATTGTSGRFKLSLPSGTYHVTGTSPLMQSGQMLCAATKELHVTASGAAGAVTVICSIP